MTMMPPTTQNATSSTGQPSAPPAVAAAVSHHKLIFGAYMALLGLTFFATYWLWKSGNAVQGAIQADADARIEEAKSSAAKANERSALLELEIAKQQERAAIAERELEQLKEKIRRRELTPQQENELIRRLSKEPKGIVGVTCVIGDSEGILLASQITKVLHNAGWPIGLGDFSETAFPRKVPDGLMLAVRDMASAPPYAQNISDAFTAVGMPMGYTQWNNMSPNRDPVLILVGLKPQQPN